MTGVQPPGGRTGRVPGSRPTLRPGTGGSAAADDLGMRLHTSGAELASDSRASSFGQSAAAEEGVLSEATNLLLGQVDSTRRKYAHEAEELRVRPWTVQYAMASSCQEPSAMCCFACMEPLYSEAPGCSTMPLLARCERQHAPAKGSCTLGNGELACRLR